MAKAAHGARGVDEVMEAIAHLSDAERSEVENRLWDARIARDAKSGKLDKVRAQARTEIARGRFSDL